MSEIKKIVEKLKTYDSSKIFYCKPLDYLCFRNRCGKKEFESDLFSGKNLICINPHKRKGELRYGLYFIYNKRRGRVYVIKFENLLKIVTIYPIGPKTLNRYNKRRFKKRGFLNIL